MEETDSAFGASKSRRASDPRPGRPHAPHPEIRQLRQLATVRSRATQCLSVCLAREPPKGDHFSIDTSNLDAAAEFVLSLAKRDYPDGQAGVDVGKIPGHSRWRHFEAGGVDRIKPMLERWEKGDYFYRSPLG